MRMQTSVYASPLTLGFIGAYSRCPAVARSGARGTLLPVLCVSDSAVRHASNPRGHYSARMPVKSIKRFIFADSLTM